MSVSINATPKDPAANCYVTEADASTFINNTRTAAECTAWNALSADERSKLLIQATRLLDSCMKWNNSPTTITQVLGWPRIAIRRHGDLGYYSQDTIPDIIQQATAEFALALSQRDRIHEPAAMGRGISRLSVGPISLAFDDTQALSLVPVYILNLLRFVGEVDEITPGGSGSRVIPLVRA